DQRRGRPACRRDCGDACISASQRGPLCVAPRAESAVTSIFRAPAEPELIRPRLHECQSCGLLQTVPALAPGISAHCNRCGTRLHRARLHPLEHSLALTVSALVLLGVTCVSTLMSVET